jgi:hypothetical protein
VSEPRPSDEPVVLAVDQLVAAVRRHLGMSLAFVAQVEDGRRYFRWVSADGPTDVVVGGGGDPVEETYCGDVLASWGGLLLPDASDSRRCR